MLNPEVKELIENYIKKADFELVDLQLKKSGGNDFIKLLVDKKEGGISVSECTKISEDIKSLLDEFNLAGENYFLEVSSPGVDRALVSVGDFKRKIGKALRVEVEEPLFEGKKEIIATLLNIEGEEIFLEGEKKKKYKIPLNLIKRAKIKLKW